MIVVAWGVSVADMSSCIVIPNMKVFYKKESIINVSVMGFVYMKWKIGI